MIELILGLTALLLIACLLVWIAGLVGRFVERLIYEVTKTVSRGWNDGKRGEGDR
jgi:hypothetical protein